MLDHWTIARKAAVMTLLTLIVVGATQWWFLADSVTDHRLFLVALAAPILICSAFAYAWARWVVAYRINAFALALKEIGDGDYDAALPDPPDPDSAIVRDAFAEMGAALNRATKEMQHTDRQRRRLFADLAHELATPLSTTLGLIEAFEKPALSDTDEKRAQLVHDLSHEAQRLEQLVRDIRDLAALDDPDVRFTLTEDDLYEVLQALVQRLSKTLSAELQFDAKPGLTATFDRLRLEQAFANLLTNAARYIPQQGVVRVSAVHETGRIVLHVDDNGEGVPDELLARLGERLLRIDPSRSRLTGGHGLGLSIVAAIVHRHNGTLGFTRSPLGGLRVSIALPTTQG